MFREGTQEGLSVCWRNVSWLVLSSLISGGGEEQGSSVCAEDGDDDASWCPGFL